MLDSALCGLATDQPNPAHCVETSIPALLQLTRTSASWQNLSSIQQCAGLVMSRLPNLTASNGKSYHIHTMGCQMNLADSERMAGALDAAGYQHADEALDADVIIYNTCSIRDKAEQKVYSALGRQVLSPTS